MDIPEELRPNPIVRKFKNLLDSGKCIVSVSCDSEADKQEVTFHYKDGGRYDLRLKDADSGEFNGWMTEYNLFSQHYLTKEHGCYRVSEKPV